MNCYDCTEDGVSRPAVAACVHWGAGIGGSRATETPTTSHASSEEVGVDKRIGWAGSSASYDGYA